MIVPPATVRQQWTERFPEMDSSAMRIAELLKRAHAQLEGALAPIHDAGPLTAPEVELLIPLRHMDEPVIARRIAEHGHMSRAGVSKAITKLEKRGFLERTPSSTDRRATLVSVTEQGKQAVDAVFPRQVDLESRVFDRLGADKEKVIEALQLLADCLDHADESALEER